jgi:hypothetical protein
MLMKIINILKNILYIFVMDYLLLMNSNLFFGKINDEKKFKYF